MLEVPLSASHVLEAANKQFKSAEEELKASIVSGSTDGHKPLVEIADIAARLPHELTILSGKNHLKPLKPFRELAGEAQTAIDIYRETGCDTRLIDVVHFGVNGLSVKGMLNQVERLIPNNL